MQWFADRPASGQIPRARTGVVGELEADQANTATQNAASNMSTATAPSDRAMRRACPLDGWNGANGDLDEWVADSWFASLVGKIDPRQTDLAFFCSLMK